MDEIDKLNEIDDQIKSMTAAELKMKLKKHYEIRTSVKMCSDCERHQYIIKKSEIQLNKLEDLNEGSIWNVWD
jgi:hypothetical protein